MNEKFKMLIAKGDHAPLIKYESLGQAAKLSIPTPEHYLPLLYILGLKEENESVSFFNDKTVMGSVSMTSLRIVWTSTNEEKICITLLPAWKGLCRQARREGGGVFQSVELD